MIRCVLYLILFLPIIAYSNTPLWFGSNMSNAHIDSINISLVFPYTITSVDIHIDKNLVSLSGEQELMDNVKVRNRVLKLDCKLFLLIDSLFISKSVKEFDLQKKSRDGKLCDFNLLYFKIYKQKRLFRKREKTYRYVLGKIYDDEPQLVEFEVVQYSPTFRRFVEQLYDIVVENGLNTLPENLMLNKSQKATSSDN